MSWRKGGGGVSRYKVVSGYLSAVGKRFFADVTMSCVGSYDFGCGPISRTVEN
jgi:hypothetical protein